MIDLSEVYALLSPGLIAGAGLGAMAWIVGYAVSKIYDIIRKG